MMRLKPIRLYSNTLKITDLKVKTKLIEPLFYKPVKLYFSYANKFCFCLFSSCDDHAKFLSKEFIPLPKA